MAKANLPSYQFHRYEHALSAPPDMKYPSNTRNLRCTPHQLHDPNCQLSMLTLVYANYRH